MTLPVYSGADAKAVLETIVSPGFSPGTETSPGALNANGQPEIETLASRVEGIIQAVKRNGDIALKAFAAQFNDPLLSEAMPFVLSSHQKEALIAEVPADTQALLKRSAENIAAFANAVKAAVQTVQMESEEASVGLDWKPVQRVACYVPAGRHALPSTALMTTLTAKAAGVSDIVLISPKLQPETVFAGQLAGVESFYQVGGAQAVAAMAYGTKSLEKVDMIVGPGNAFVNEAKRQLQGTIGIDMLAGPSEVVIIADATANPTWVAWDLLAQAEHDSDARAYLLTSSQSLASAVVEALKQIIAQDWSARFDQSRSYSQEISVHGLTEHLNQTDWGAIFCLESLEDCIQWSNALAPEHLELLVGNPEAIEPGLLHYGALFMGHQTPVPVGDYMAGPNHTLPTHRTARFSGGLTPLTFLRPQTRIKVHQKQSTLLTDTAQFAQLEGLFAHQQAVLQRFTE